MFGLISRRTLAAFIGGCALVGGIIGWFTYEVDTEV